MIISSLQEFYNDLLPNSQLLGIDFGARKMGIAISDHNKIMALPLEVVTIRDDQAKISYILDLVIKYKICGIVIGLPINMDGTNSDQTQIVINFAEKLSTQTSLPIFMQDERLSSAAANSLLKEAGMSRKDRHDLDDQVAASLILETVLSSFLGSNTNNT